MKKLTVKLLSLLVITASGITSCSSNDSTNEIPKTGFVANPSDFKGTINEGEVVLDASKVYKLTGKIIVNNNATLTIPAGTVIEGSAGTASYIAVAQGGKINVNGTATNPVVMTSGKATKAGGDWGGLVICGKAPINRVSGGASTAQSEVGDLTYGGTLSNDNSGSIKYLRIEYAGALFNAEKEFNGLSLFGVGSGTTISYVQLLHGSDDGVEFFGGTVNTDHIISIGNEDDQFDWTEGWSGTNTDWYGRLDYGTGNRGIEADNYEFGFANTPIATPTITNLTLIGPGSTANKTAFAENQAIKLRRGTKGIFKNVVVKGWATGVDIEHDETLANAGTSLKITDFRIESDVPTILKGKTTAGVSATVNENFATSSTTATGAGNGVEKPTWAAGWAAGF